MRTVMLVDDEYWTLQGLERLFDWPRHGYSVTGAYDDSVSAFKDIREKAPDLVLTDIRMPEMSGIELIRRAREAGIRSVFVVISGYSDFEYARGALNMARLIICLSLFPMRMRKHCWFGWTGILQSRMREQTKRQCPGSRKPAMSSSMRCCNMCEPIMLSICN